MIRSVCARKGITQPIAVVSSSDPMIQQMLGLANEEGQDLSSRYPWQVLQNESTFLTVATESQGVLTTLAGTGFRYILNEIMWNRDLRRPVFGPLQPYQWQQLRAQNITGPWNQFRIRGNAVRFIPAPAAGQTIAFEWISKFWATGAGGDAGNWAADADTGLLDEDIMTLGVLWRWLKSKGLSYAEEYTQYERLVADAMARDSGKPVLNMNGANLGYSAGIFVPLSGWVGH